MKTCKLIKSNKNTVMIADSDRDSLDDIRESVIFEIDESTLEEYLEIQTKFFILQRRLFSLMDLHRGA